MTDKTNPSESFKFSGSHSPKGSALQSRRIADLSVCKKRSLSMANHLRDEASDLSREAWQVRGCANYLVFNNYYTIDEIKLAKVRTCKKHLLCPFCARARGHKSHEAYRKKFDALVESSPGLKPIFLTLTVKNGDDLQERFEHLKSSFRVLQERRRDYLKKGRGKTEFRKLDGAVFSYEVTNKENGWHPHIHMIALAHDWIDREKLSAEWEQITGDSKIVDVRKIDDGAFSEVFKYALKFSELTLDKNVLAYRSLGGKRLQGSFGSFRGVTFDDDAVDPIDDYAELPFMEMFYKFNKQTKHYDVTDIAHKEPISSQAASGKDAIPAPPSDVYTSAELKFFVPTIKTGWEGRGVAPPQIKNSRSELVESEANGSIEASEAQLPTVKQSGLGRVGTASITRNSRNSRISSLLPDWVGTQDT